VTSLLSQAGAEDLGVAASMNDEAEADLVREAVAANPRACDALVRRHSARVFNFLFQLTRHRQDAEDLAQQTFVKAFRNLDRFDCERPLINWLLTIARRTALNHFRDAKRWTTIPHEGDLASGEPSPARQAEQAERTENLWARARRVLSPREFEVLWLRFGEEMSTDETAHITGLTVVHVKVIVHRARQQLLKGETSS
jgi:RNA polymerase sigma-70 factor, ECF subfamily